MKQIIFFLILMTLSIVRLMAQVPEQIMSGFKSSDSKEIAKSFSSSVNLKILDKEDVYSKAQAEQILKDFFSKHPVKAFSLVHQGNSKSGARYTICKYETGGDSYRTYIYLKKGDDNKEFIQELRIEPDNH